MGSGIWVDTSGHLLHSGRLYPLFAFMSCKSRPSQYLLLHETLHTRIYLRHGGLQTRRFMDDIGFLIT